MRYTLKIFIVVAVMVFGIASVAMSQEEADAVVEDALTEDVLIDTDDFVDTDIESATLIDFSRLASDVPDSYLNSATLLSFFDLFPTSAGVSLKESDRDSIQISLSIAEWDVLFMPSSRYPRNQQNSDVRQVTLGDNATQYPGEVVMGARVNFPYGARDAWAMIIPPYTIPRINPQLSSNRTIDYRGVGQIQNVDTIQSISANVYGLNYPFQLQVMLENQHGKLEYYLVGDLNYTGWRTLTWTNPSFDEIAAVPNTNPIYPSTVSSLVFRGFRIVKTDPVRQEDFVGYFKDVTVDYKPAVNASLDIDNEAIWGLVEESELFRRQQEFVSGGGTSIFYQYITKQQQLQHELENQ